MSRNVLFGSLTYQYHIKVPANRLSEAKVIAMMRSVRFSWSVYRERVVIVTGATVPFAKVVLWRSEDEPLRATVVYIAGSSIVPLLLLTSVFARSNACLSP